MSKPTITCNPDPPTQGQDTVVHYSGTNPQDLETETVPPGLLPSPVTTDANGNVLLTMPDNIQTLTVKGGGAVALTVTVQPGS
jgi:hypothetical protein